MTPTKWTLDPAHSEIQFKVRHMMIANVTGQFNSFTSEIKSPSDDFKNARISFNADVSSIDTNNEQRDNHLKSGDFFDLEKFSNITFTTKDYNATTNQVSGDLTIKDVKKPITLNAEFHGINKDPYGNIKAGFSLDGKINRSDFGLNWNAALETGGLLVSEDVRIYAELQFIKEA